MSSSTDEQYGNIDFSAGDAGASHTRPTAANGLRVGGHVILDGDKPCKIIQIIKSKPGKHGHAKLVIAGTDIFTGKKHDGGGPAAHSMTVPVVKRNTYMLLYIKGQQKGGKEFLSLFDYDARAEKPDDVKLPDGELGERIKAAFSDEKSIDVVVLSAMGKEVVVDFSLAKND
ncbi:Uu.00g086960.m01.CDS01 [Anthostomella pinea]|uniref:Eukaryotic translation initiation factor 5A n=1 Tax=Anthostomella pinea TaxID=933095 RepID=A0AAI8VNE2_9PEZI|nr:Uu.00g086960.m01.CDS01 [Anthostomella pinea]